MGHCVNDQPRPKLIGRLKANAHGLLQTFIVDGHLDGHMRQLRVDLLVGQRLHCGVISRVLVELGNRSDTVGKG